SRSIASVISITLFSPLSPCGFPGEVASATPNSVTTPTSPHTAVIVYSAAGDLADRVGNGEAADVLIATQAQLEDLKSRGKVRQGSVANFVNVATAVSVLKGALKPDISSVDAFKRTVLAAKSIAYIDPAVGGPVGIYLVDLFERLGIAAELKPKTILTKGPLSQAMLKGGVQMVISAISEITYTPQVDLVGRLPTAIEFVSYFLQEWLRPARRLMLRTHSSHS